MNLYKDIDTVDCLIYIDHDMTNNSLYGNIEFCMVKNLSEMFKMPKSSEIPSNVANFAGLYIQFMEKLSVHSPSFTLTNNCNRNLFVSFKLIYKGQEG